jgi:hypothetical protein
MKNLVGHAIKSLLNHKIERKQGHHHMLKITHIDTNEGHHESCKYPIICKKLINCWIEEVMVYWTSFAILNLNQWKCLAQDFEEYSCIDACIKKFCTSLKTLETKFKRGDATMNLVMWKWNMQESFWNSLRHS